MKKWKNCLSAALAFCCLLGCMVFAPAASAAEQTFDAEHIVLRFPAISDIHLGGGGTNTKFLEALDQLKAKGKLDAIMVGGDFTDYGTDGQVKDFCSILTSKINLNDTRLILAMGNHELFERDNDGVPFRVHQYLKNELGDRYQHGAPAEDTEACRYHTKVNGFDMLAISCMSFNAGGVKYKQEDVDWLDRELSRTDPTKPVFVTTHAMLKGTEWGSDFGSYWAEQDGKLRACLNKHPNVILFSGHLHFPLNHDLSIWQGEFTGVGTSSVYYAGMDDHTKDGLPYLFVGNGTPADAYNYSQGILAEVDQNGNTRLTRMDFHNRRLIGEPWVIPAPKADKSHLKPYSEAHRKAVNQAPYFEASAKVNVQLMEDKKDPKLQISFPKAKDDSVVVSYQLIIRDQKGNELKRVALYSDFYRATSETSSTMMVQLTNAMLYPFTVKYPENYTCSVVAYDCFESYSKPIVSKVIEGTGEKKEQIVVTQKPRPEWQYKTFCNFNKFPEGYLLKAGPDYNSWPSPDMEEAAKHRPFGKDGWQGSAGLVTEITSGENYLDVIFSNPKQGFQTDFEGAHEFWIWMDCSDVTFRDCYFGFRVGDPYGDEYITQSADVGTMQAYLLPEGETEWKTCNLATEAGKSLSGFKGFVRFSVEHFLLNEPMNPTRLAGFVFSFTPAENQVGKTFTLDQIGFAGPKIKDPDGLVSMLLEDKQQFDDKQKLPEPKEEPVVPVWLFVTIGVVLAAVIGAVIVALIRRKKK